MNATPTKYFGDETTYPRMVRDITSGDIESIEADVVFEELVNNKTFIKEARNARKDLIKNPHKYPNLTLRYKSFF